MTAAPSIVVIGIDMGDGQLIRDWAGAGHLPNIASLLERGTWFDLDTTAGILHTSAWPTFATGDLPGRHGVYYPYQPAPGHQEAQLIQPDQYAAPTFWSRADADGIACIIYDVPETFPEPSFSGKAIFELGTWAWYGNRASVPEELLGEITQRFGKHPLKMEAKKLGLKFPDRTVLEKRLIQSIAHKRDTFRWLLDNSAWQLAVTVFCETHPAGHYLWPQAAGADPDTGDASFAAIRRVYVALDEAIGDIVDNLPAGTAVMLASGDGVKTNNCGWHLLPDVLLELGYSTPPVQASGEARPNRLSLGGLKAMMPPKMRRLIADNLPWWLRDKIGATINAAQIDWSTSRAFTLPTDLEGCIRINLKGREPNGIVEPGREYEDLCREIADEMRRLVNPETGESAVENVWIVREHFDGPVVDHLPDITVTWNNSAPINALASDRLNTVTGEPPDPRTGTHSDDGFALVCAGSTGSAEAGGGRLIDLAPTVLDMLGRSYSGMDGKPLTFGQKASYDKFLEKEGSTS